jgi:hypothetical protein
MKTLNAAATIVLFAGIAEATDWRSIPANEVPQSTVECEALPTNYVERCRDYIFKKELVESWTRTGHPNGVEGIPRLAPQVEALRETLKWRDRNEARDAAERAGRR